MQSENDESWLTGWEQQCIEAVQNETDYEEVLNSQTDTVQRNVWSAFQDSATAVAQLYRGEDLSYQNSYVKLILLFSRPSTFCQLIDQLFWVVYCCYFEFSFSLQKDILMLQELYGFHFKLRQGL